MKDDSLSKQLIRLACTEIILHHAEVDSSSDFIDNLQEDLYSTLPSEIPPKEVQDEENGELPRIQEELPGRHFFSSVISRLKGDKRLAILSAVAIVLFLPTIFLLLWSNVHYKDKILPGTQYAAIELSSNPEEALKQIESASSGYKYSLTFDQTTTNYGAEDVGIGIDAAATVDAAKQQSNQVGFFARPFALLGARNVQSVVSLDQNKLKLFLEAQSYSDKLPEDAKIEFSTEQNKFIAIPEIAGRGIDSKSLATKLQNSAADLNTAAIDLNIEDVTPSITARDLQEPLTEANKIISQKITINSPSKNYSPTPEIMKDWVTLTADPVNSTYTVNLNEKAPQDYLDSVIAKVNRKMEKRLYASIDGIEILLQEGSPGLQVSNIDSAKSGLLGLVKSRQGGTVALEAKEEASTTENIAASGGRWIFADLSQYRIYAYEGATLINSFPMSSGTAATPTPTGNFSVMSKIRVKTMTSGGNKNSKDYYSVPNIEWVAYFKSGGYAMHGVYWHNRFGVENRSHGCMGMSNSDAQWVYNFIEIGTPVIVVA